MGELRPFQLRDLMVPQDLARNSSRYLILLLPDGGIELTQVPGRPEVVLWLYSNATNLVASCGDGQPWTYARTGLIRDLVTAIDGPVLLAIDVWHPDGARYPEPDVAELEPLDYLDEPSMPADEVWIPSRPVRTGDRRVDVELHSVEGDPTPCLLVYDSLARLRALPGGGSHTGGSGRRGGARSGGTASAVQPRAGRTRTAQRSREGLGEPEPLLGGM